MFSKSNLNDEDNKQIHKFIKKNYNLILETLSIREHYYDLLQQYMGFFYISDDLFTAKLFYTTNGEVSVDINIVDNHEFKSEYSKKWYKRESISEFVEKNKDEVLKRILVPVNNLNGGYDKLYETYKEKNNQKVKTLTKISN